jgi:tetratricopeptide (TPR) repeat protein
MAADPPPKTYPGVMVSSTFTDLESHRAALLKALAAAGLMPIAMEGATAQLNDVIDSSLRMVRDASAVILLVSHKYGQTPHDPARNPGSLSITELEFNEATRLRRPVLVFLMGENHPVTRADIETDPARSTKLEAFRTRAKAHPDSGVPRIYATFDNLEDFRVKAERSLPELQTAISAATIQNAPPDPLAMKWTVADGKLRLAPSDEETDARALEDPFVQALQDEIVEKATALLAPAQRLINSEGWSRLSPVAVRFHRAICCEPSQVVANLPRLYSAMLSLGSFYELHQAITQASNIFALEPEVAQPLSDLIRTAAPWLRRFPSVRTQDDEGGAFLKRKELFEPARIVLRAAYEHDLVDDADREIVADLIAAGQGEGFVTDKAATRGVASVGGLVRASALVLAGIYSGSVASDFSTRSALVKAAGRTLHEVEQSALALVPQDLASALRSILRRSRESTGSSSYEIAETLAKRDELSFSEMLQKMKHGDQHIDNNNLVGALDCYHAAVGIATRIIDAAPAYAPLQRQLANAHSSLGRIHHKLANIPSALDSHLAALAIIGRVAADNPADAQAQRDLSLFHERLGDFHLHQGNLTFAAVSFRAARAAAGGLVAIDPANTEWQRVLAVSHTKLGDLHRAQGDLQAAAASHRAALAIAERLAAADPANAEWQRDLAFSHGNLALTESGPGADARARAHLTRGRDIIRRLAALSPTDAALKTDLDWFDAEIARRTP